jgi:hypothetical protein
MYFVLLSVIEHNCLLVAFVEINRSIGEFVDCRIRREIVFFPLGSAFLFLMGLTVHGMDLCESILNFGKTFTELYRSLRREG